MKSTPAKVLFVDIETAPSLGWVWGKWQQDVIDFKTDWYLLSCAWKWAHNRKVEVVGLPDFPNYKPDSDNDRAIVERLWELLNEADIIVAHNGDGFDLPKINTRFISLGLQPPKPYQTIDTLKIARAKFKFDSNKLDELGRYLKLGRKLPHTGFHLWRGCMAGDKRAWATMKRYNAKDVALLEKVYYRMRPWHGTHPSVTAGEAGCPKCSSSKASKRGFTYTIARRRKQRFQCLSCFGWFLGPAVKV